MLEKLLDAGMDVARFNFSHGTYDYHSKLMDNVRQAAKNKKRSITIALDTKGPEIRTGTFPKGETELKKGANITVTVNDKFKAAGDSSKFWVTYSDLPKSVSKGSLIYIDDGLICLEVNEVKGDNVNCTVKNGGMIDNRKGVNLPNAKVTLPALSEKDINDIKFGVRQNVDMIFASFIRKKEDVIGIRKLLPESVHIISKIENQEGCDNFEEILEVSDGIMVARGDLGIEIDATRVFVEQKRMIRLCRRAGKPVIVATQMLQSMVSNPRPTRAEVSDVANAVLDGADCVMLSGETAKGKYPIQAVEQMSKTCRMAEDNLNLPPLVKPKNISKRESVVASAVTIAMEQGAAAIVCLTNKGTTARRLARHRPTCPIIAVIGKAHQSTARHLALTFGVHTTVFDDTKEQSSSPSIRIKSAIQASKTTGLLKSGDLIICVYSADHQKYGNIIDLSHVD